MTVLQAAILGVVQGLSEFLPISSSGHLILVPWLFDWDHVLADESFNKTFDVALHIGTFVGAAFYLRRDVGALIRDWFSSVRARAVDTPERRLAWYVVLSVIPAALLGALAESTITEKLGEPWQIAVLLAVFGVVLWWVDRSARQETHYAEISGRQAVAMAAGQALALAPGVSRSGITMTCGRAMGLTRDAAARFSFVISLPVTLGAAVYKGAGLIGETDPLRGQGTQFAVGIVTSGITGAFAVWGLLAFLRRYSTGVFAAYRVLAAAVVLVVITTGARAATI